MEVFLRIERYISQLGPNGEVRGVDKRHCRTSTSPEQADQYKQD